MPLGEVVGQLGLRDLDPLVLEAGWMAPGARNTNELWALAFGQAVGQRQVESQDS